MASDAERQLLKGWLGRLKAGKLVCDEAVTADLVNIVDVSNIHSLATTAMSLRDVQKMVGLIQILDVEFDSVAPVALPEDLSISRRSVV
ncbi:unnamed protein product [Penicillium salamii]|nr:unnamed protein product [Penicillium salamii]CAG8168683.1 unnamed protein product [Penicillium salamii]CAG8247544.1 unnamed protein product [Penicillium salamii]